MATSTPTTPPTLPPIPATITVADDGADVLLIVRLTPDDMLDLLLRALGTVGRLKKVAAP